MMETSTCVHKGSLTAEQRKFSLVLATIWRTHEVERFLCSLDRQHDADFELIVVDQNTDSRLVPYLEARKNKYPILHVRSEPGLSRARNVGLRHVSGSFVAFPDDDCWYPEGLLSRVWSLLSGNPDWDGITGISVDAEGKPSNGRFATSAGKLDVLRVWFQAISYTIFLRHSVIEAIGRFDETLGVGAGTAFGSGEETDYLIRTIQSGFTIHYLPDIHVHHPNPLVACDRRARSYGTGMSRVVRKHGYPAWFKVKILIRPLGGVLLSLAGLRPNKALYHLNSFLGRLEGLRADPRSKDF